MPEQFQDNFALRFANPMFAEVGDQFLDDDAEPRQISLRKAKIQPK